jgi:hypothetical protein
VEVVTKTMVLVHLLSQSAPMKIENVLNTYTKDGLFCVYHDDVVDKFPLVNIFRITEPYTYVIKEK